MRFVDVAVLLTRFLGDEPQPGMVEAQISDWEGRQHTFLDKLPIFTADEPTRYPAVGTMRVQVIDELALAQPWTRLLISTEHPFYICDASGEPASFWIHGEQVVEAPEPQRQDMTPAPPILFYATDKPYGEFSNFSRHPTLLDGVVWPTSEHYFQAQKFAGTPHVEEVRAQPTPMLAAQMGRRRDLPFRVDWNDVKDDVMRAALRAKFTQHPALRSLLLGTGDAVLVEHTRNDAYWADGGDGTGRNRLGELLMELRGELREEP